MLEPVSTENMKISTVQFWKDVVICVQHEEAFHAVQMGYPHVSGQNQYDLNH